MLKTEIMVKNMGIIGKDSDFVELGKTSDGFYTEGKDGVKKIFATGDKKVEFVSFDDKTLAFVPSAVGYSAYYPIFSAELNPPVKAVLMDLDGTSVKSEEFWMSIIGATVAELIKNPKFTLDEADAPFVAGHGVSEHLSYCIEKYCPNVTLDEARAVYYQKTDYELKEIMAGRGRKNAFTPTDGLKDFLYFLKEKNIKIGLVTSGLYEKAMPEIISAFDTLKMGDPLDFYDAIITAGNAFNKKQTGNMSELPIKPHPWVYSETGRYGLGIPFEERSHVLAIEDSGAGVCAARLAGYYTVGLAGGNIVSSGTKSLCGDYANTLEDIKNIIISKL